MRRVALNVDLIAYGQHHRDPLVERRDLGFYGRLTILFSAHPQPSNPVITARAGRIKTSAGFA